MSVVRQLAGTVLGLSLIAAIAVPTDLTLYAAVAVGINWFIGLVHAIPFKTERFFDLTGTLTFFTVAVVVGLHTTSLHPTGIAFYRSVTTSLMVVIWTVRLGSFLYSRIHGDGGIDSRFVEIRHLPLRFFSTWTIQAAWVFISISPILLLQTQSSQANVLTTTDVVGTALYLVGLIVEVVADAQKTVFRANVANKDSFISTGLWAYSRHPNYCGEITLWVGIAIVCVPQLPTVALQLTGCISPLFVFLLLNFVSGIPLLEKKANAKWGDDATYQAYKARTSELMLWFPKTNASVDPVKVKSTDYGTTPIHTK
ncbi:Aste57867_10607 [Aphanomyces stellatus]|uniref:Aste57867_10607 protein n=1 Tax=Aphanomyces stellatus TaxID=120398 RepID=A0A485KQT5_9STRA|nr:hypothetical protein As57867_010567 [Aphanomyces stellatus]VFT87479.1 Aste57867_10607 [Aphanomyces stellatus]